MGQEVLGDLADGSLPFKEGWVAVDLVVAGLHRPLLCDEADGGAGLVTGILAWVQAHDVLREGERFLLTLINEDRVLLLHSAEYNLKVNP